MAEQDVVMGTDAPLHEVMRTMRAMRRLKPDPVPREHLETMVEAATWAPSGSNLQAFSFVIVTDREKMARLAELWQTICDWYLQTIGAVTPEVMDEAAYERMRKAVRYQADHFAETPAVIIACYDLGQLTKRVMRNWRNLLAGSRKLGLRRNATVARHMQRLSGASEAGSILPGVQNLLLTARALGLGATLTTWHIALEPEFKDVLGIPGNINTHALVPVGYPRGKLGPVRRRPLEEAIHWEGW